MAVTLVTRHDQRLMGELEKLLKTKIEVEHLEFEEERPHGRQNDGRRRYRDVETGDARDDMRRQRSERRGGDRPARPAAAPADPFFDKPYEATAPADDAAPPAWERQARPARSGVSANIKPKVKVAALFKAPQPTS